MKRFAISCVSAALCGVSLAMDATLLPRGAVRLRLDRDYKIEPLVFLSGWRGGDIKGGYEIKTPGRAEFKMEDGGRRIFDVTASLEQMEGGKVKLVYDFKAADEVALMSIGCVIRLNAGDMTGRPWRIDDRRGEFHHPTNGIGVVFCNASSVGFALGKSGKALRIASDSGVLQCLVQDDKKWSDNYSVRLGALGARRCAKGETLSFSFVLSSSEPLSAASSLPHVIAAGDEWLPLEYRRDIEKGSALDFSQMGFADAPAGRHGWLRNVGGHFEFEGLPGRRQRFYGVNFCGTANFPDHALADTLVTRLKRLGYNALRIHHHDSGTVNRSADGLTLNVDSMEQLDYLLAAAIREGLYITTDLFVSRSRVIKCRHIGIDRDGTIDMQLFKALCAVYEPAFQNWAEYARNFLLHENKYTGRRYVDEPALPLISLVNEGGLFMGWGRGVRDDPHMLASWKAWLSARRATDPSFASDLSEDELPANFWANGIHPALAQWTGELEARMVARMKAYLRALGCKALLTNDNCGPHYASLQLATSEYDYIDDHFYVDHPRFLEKSWNLPSTCPNRNPLLGDGRISPSTQAYTRMFGKPFTITEWNFAGPGRYRGVGGILTGAMASLQDWDGLWRFAYSHSRDSLGDRDQRSPGYFDLASDPLSQAGERACLCLFLRGDLAPHSNGVALWVTPESAASSAKTFNGAPKWSDVAWRMRVGSCLSPEDAKGLRVVRREVADDAVPDIGEGGRNPLRIDRERGAFVIDTPRTCGGFAPEGLIDAECLKVKVSLAPATVWVHSLDGAGIPQSGRLLLTHLTDVQGDGAVFSDESMTTIVKWGWRPLVQNGIADVSLKLDKPADYTVYELDTAGRRRGIVPSAVKGGMLTFAATTRGPNGGRIHYEIAR
ncbi:MAG: hypothetical protein IJH50_08620 [Kiritimatiellae bacterium]|nr:hypothetical protein [Kiritimatiellia bacterium]